MKRARRAAYVGILVAALIGAGFFLIGGWQSFAGPYPKYEERSLKRSEQAYQANERVNQMLIDAWWHYQLFTWKWWFNVGLATVPWFVWVWLRPRASTHRVLYVGFYYIIIASYLDFMGVTYGLWRYHIEIVPSIPSYIPWDFTMYPVGGMLVFQFDPRLSKHLKAVLFACAAGLVVEPLFIWLHFYEPVHWSVFYSLPIHYVNYLVADWLGTRMAFRPLDPANAVPPWNPPATKKT